MQKWLQEIRLHLALSPQKIGILIFIFTAVCSLAFQLFSFVTDTAHKSPRFCVDSKTAITKQLDTLKSCERDEDCTLFKANCPFTCHAVNKQVNSQALTSRIQAYTKECGMCVAEECNSNTPRCVNRQCVL